LGHASRADVLVALNARLRGIAGDVPFVPDARTLRRVQPLTLSTDEGELDLLVDPPGSPGYATLRRRADVVRIDGSEIRVASIEDLIAMKQAAGRPQDQIDVEALQIVRSRLRGRRRAG
jgi:hypothetical protein